LKPRSGDCSRLHTPFPLTARASQKQHKYARIHGLSAQDATIYSLVKTDLRRRDIAEPKCFISKNFKHFGSPEIRTELQSYDCRYITRCADGLGYARST
jgi:hypothetical protein